MQITEVPGSVCTAGWTYHHASNQMHEMQINCSPCGLSLIFTWNNIASLVSAVSCLCGLRVSFSMAVPLVLFALMIELQRVTIRTALRIVWIVWIVCIDPFTLTAAL